MTNAERYKDLLRKLYKSKERWAIEKDTNNFIPMWEDKEPYSIKGILKNCRVIGDNIVMHEVV